MLYWGSSKSQRPFRTGIQPRALQRFLLYSTNEHPSPRSLRTLANARRFPGRWHSKRRTYRTYSLRDDLVRQYQRKQHPICLGQDERSALLFDRLGSRLESFLSSFASTLGSRPEAVAEEIRRLCHQYGQSPAVPDGHFTDAEKKILKTLCKKLVKYTRFVRQYLTAFDAALNVSDDFPSKVDARPNAA